MRCSTDDGYPLVTVANSTGRQSTAAASGLTPSRVDLQRMDDDDATLVDLLTARLVDGGCIGIVRNTVARAQHTAQLLERALTTPVVLLHSRFLAVDRLTRETRLRKLLGPPSPDVERPSALVVVGTQVLEQSLDVDFDLLISDLAPIDLLLQRIGRLHRHMRSRPSALQQPTCLVTGCDWSASPPAPDGGSQSIYGASALLRSLAVLQNRWADGLQLPSDIPVLVRAAYSESPPGPEEWCHLLAEADELRQQEVASSLSRASTYLLGEVEGGSLGTLAGLLVGHVGDARDDTVGAAQVRDTEDGIEIVAVYLRDGELRVLPGDHPRADAVLSRDYIDPSLARTLAGHTLRLPRQLTRPRPAGQVIEFLEKRTPGAWQLSSWLRGQLVLTFDAALGATLGDYRLRYDLDHGLIHTPLESS